MTKQFDPNWPFPQFDEEGVQLLPPDIDVPNEPYDFLADVGEALL